MEVWTFDVKRELVDLEKMAFQENAFFLWVIHANKIPPHIGISEGNAFYSLKANGKDEGVAVRKMIRVLKKKNIAVLVYEIASEAILEGLKSTIQQYATTIPGKVTCLQPLKDILGDSEATRVADLLKKLEVTGKIKREIGWQLPRDFSGIPDYQSADIHRRLELLSNV